MCFHDLAPKVQIVSKHFQKKSNSSSIKTVNEFFDLKGVTQIFVTWIIMSVLEKTVLLSEKSIWMSMLLYTQV